MSVYFVGSDERAIPAMLPCQSQIYSHSPDILENTDLHRRERQRLLRNLVTCDRSLQKRADQKLETFKCQQALHLSSSDTLAQQRDKLKILEIRIARSVHLPVAAQEIIISEKRRVQAEMSNLIDSFETKTKCLDMQTKQDTIDFDRLRDVRMSLQRSLATVDEKLRTKTAIQSDASGPVDRDKLEGLNDPPQLAQFLQVENAYYLFDICLSIGITSVEKLMSLNQEDIR
jgi:hypothetical protein